ncbi:MAG: hypothetical protein KKA42_09065, partial [candidate division Zixibacteria bacterium]|nr:hypothetical protein [candidate division Zixibacteria bacterium]
MSEVSGDNGHNTRLQLRPVQVLNEAQEGGDNGHYILAYNSLLTNDDPAIFGWRGYPVHEVEDDPVRLTVNDWRLYNDAKRGSRLIASAGYRSDSAWAFWLDPLTDETDYVYLCSGSDATGDGVWHPLLLLVLVADYDFDGKTEAFVYVSSGRDLVPRELFCVEMETLTVEWSLPVASLLNESNFLSCGDSANPAVIFTTYNVKQGISDTAFSDMHGDVAVVDASGHILTHRVVTTKHGGNQIRAHLRPGEYLLSHEI